MNELNTNNNVSENNEIDLLELFYALLRKWYLLLLCAIVGAIVMGGLAYVSPDVYRSQSEIFILSRSTSISSMVDLQLSSVLSDDFVVIAKSKPVLDTAIRSLYEKDGIALTRSQANSAIRVEVLEGTRIIKFTTYWNDPVVASDLCNSITEAMSEQIAIIMQSDKPTLVEAAEPAIYPQSKGVERQTLLGAVAGFAICAAILAVLFLTDDKVKSPEDVEKYLGATILGVIPMDRAQIYETKHEKHAKKKE